MATLKDTRVVYPMPGEGTRTRRVWEIADAVTRETGRQLAVDAGLLREQTREQGLSLGDRACLALGIRENVPVLTADRAWAQLDLDVSVRLVR